MKSGNIVKDKSYHFALNIVRVVRELQLNKKEFVLSNQLMRSGTSIGANVEEAIGAASRKDFLNKMTIAYKEARETHYWLRLLKDSKYLNEKVVVKMNGDCLELMKIIGSIQKTIKKHD